MKKVNSVKEIKELINEVMLPGYTFKTCFSSPECIVVINNKLDISAILVEKGDVMEYKYILDMQIFNDSMIDYDELVVVQKVIDILEYNREFVLKKFKKYTVEEYEKEQEEDRKRAKEMLDAFERALFKMNGLDYKLVKEEEFERKTHKKTQHEYL